MSLPALPLICFSFCCHFPRADCGISGATSLFTALGKHLEDNVDFTVSCCFPTEFRSDISELGSRTGKDESEEALWLATLRYWAAAKTSGLGYSLYYSGSNLGGAVLINFMPFFLPTFSMNRSKATLVDDPAIEHDMLASMEATETEEDSTRREVVATRVAVGMGGGAELTAADVQRHEGIGLQACAA